MPLLRSCPWWLPDKEVQCLLPRFNELSIMVLMRQALSGQSQADEQEPDT
jgi:hypothetical protein